MFEPNKKDSFSIILDIKGWQAKYIDVENLPIDFYLKYKDLLFSYKNLGKSKEEVLNANKNFMIDVVIPIIALLLTILLLIKFNWVQQFSTKLDDGTTTINLKAVISMIIGYLILPIILRIYMRAKK